MDWKEIAAVSGKSGLYYVVKPTRAGFILESIDEEKKRFMAGQSVRVSVLHEISIYTEEDAVALSEVMQKIKSEKGEISVDPKADGAELMEFLGSVIPDYDTEKVYASDVKKLISWYNIISEYCPELLEDKKEEEITEVEEVQTEEKEESKSQDVSVEGETEK